MKNILIITLIMLLFTYVKEDKLFLVKDWNMATIEAIDLLYGEVDSLYLNQIKVKYSIYNNKLSNECYRLIALNVIIDKYDSLFNDYNKSKYLILEVVDYSSDCPNYILTILKLGLNNNVTKYIYDARCETVVSCCNVDKGSFIKNENYLLQVADDYYSESEDDVYSIVSFIDRGKLYVKKPLVGLKEYIY